MGAHTRKTIGIVIDISAILGIGAVALYFLVRLLGRASVEGSEVTVVVVRKASAESNEREVAEPLERKINQVAGLRELRSESKATGVTITCAFEARKDLDPFTVTE